MAAKVILEQRMEIVLPRVVVTFYGGSRHTVPLAMTQRYALENVTLEHRLGGTVPDVLATVKGRPLLIEIRVTHAVDNNKLQKLEQLGISGVEIDLSTTSRSFEIDALSSLIVDNPDTRLWLYNADVERKRQEFFAAGVRKPTVRNVGVLHVMGCPIPGRVWEGWPYANLLNDCYGCVYAMDIAQEYVPDRGSVLCNGHQKGSH